MLAVITTFIFEAGQVRDSFNDAINIFFSAVALGIIAKFRVYY